MPTYQYACTECGVGFDAVQAFTDEALTECPQCGGRLRKVFGNVGVVFKGSGFYRTDSREAAGKAAAAAAAKDGKGSKDGKPSSDGGGGTGGSDKGGSDKKTDAKPAAAASSSSSAPSKPSSTAGSAA